MERATGTPFAQFAAKNIFEPLGMTVTHYHTDESRLVKWRALAYEGPGTDFRLDTPSNERAGAGGLFTSVRDLLRWDENFYTAQVGGRSVIDRLQTRGTLNNGTTLAYAWGLEIGSYRGLRIVEHAGSLGGYRAHLLRFPDQHASVAVLCNLGSIDPSTLARRRVGRVPRLAIHRARGSVPRSGDGSAASAIREREPAGHRHESTSVRSVRPLLQRRGRRDVHRRDEGGPADAAARQRRRPGRSRAGRRRRRSAFAV